MLKFLLKCGLFIVAPLPLIVPLAFAVQHLADSGLKMSRAYHYGVWEDIYEGKLDSPIWVVGSSRAWVHISPSILEKGLGQSVYNLGIDGYPFPMQKARFEIALKYNQKPRYIIQSLDDNTLADRDDLFEKQQFLPFINEDDVYLATQKYTGHFNLLDRYIPLYKYRDDRNLLLLGLASRLKILTPSNELYKGYQGQPKSWDESAFQDFFSKYPNGLVQSISAADAEIFNEYLSECKNDGIQIILVFAPTYIEGQKIVKNRDSIINYYKQIAYKYKIPFFDYSNHPIVFDKEYFYNNQHLNKQGAELFSQVLLKDLKQDLKL